MYELVRDETTGQELIAEGTQAEMDELMALLTEDLADDEANTYAVQPA